VGCVTSLNVTAEVNRVSACAKGSKLFDPFKSFVIMLESK